ncbi:MAG: segregation/condensation protein A [Acidimicrobiia bacterium]
MSFHVKTTVFEGPLDLLLQLISKHQVEVTAVGLTEVVTEYVSFLEEMKGMDLEVTSEFTLIAATLIQLKAQSLLPGRSEFDMDEELALFEERDRLLSRLLACVTFKDVGAVLLRRLHEANRYVPRISGVDQRIQVMAPDLTIPVDSAGLAAIAFRVFIRRDAEPDLDHLDLDLPSVESAIDELRSRVAELTMASFDDLTEHCQRPVEVAAYFLALLELARWGLIAISQEDWLGEIRVEHRDIDGVDLTSEWAAS